MRIDGINRDVARQLVPAREGALTGPTALRESPAAPEGALAAREAPQPHATNPQAMTSVQMLVAVSALGPVDERRRMQMAQARKGLDMLGQLHREMLSGVAGRVTLEALAQWVAERPESDDPKLSAFIADIDLRAQVELAKFDIER